MHRDNVTYVTVFGLGACLKDLNLGRQVHGQMLRVTFSVMSCKEM